MNNFIETLANERSIFHKIFLQFLIQDIWRCTCVCKSWKNTIFSIFQQDLISLKSKFQQKYSHMLTIQNQSHFIPKNQMALYRSIDGCKMSIDFILRLKIKQKSQIKEKTKYSLSYSYELLPKSKKKMLQSRKKAKKYCWNIQFEYVGNQLTQKTVWLYKDSKNQINVQSQNEKCPTLWAGNSESLPYIMDCMPIRINQTLQIKLPYCVRNSFLQLRDFEFYAATVQTTYLGTIDRFFQKRPVTSCYIQNIYQWKKYDYFSNPISFDLDDAINCYKDELTLDQIYINTAQDHFKVEFVCRKPLKQSPFMGHLIQILSKNQKNLKACPSIVSLKRKGIYEQKRKKLIFSIHDRLIVYLCQMKNQ